MDPHHERRGRHGLEPGHAGGDRRRLALELRAGLRVDRRDGRDREVELAVGLQAPGLELVVGRGARGEVHRLGRRGREGRVEPGDQRPEVGRDLGRPLHRHAAGRRDELREELRGPLVGVVGVGDERLEHRDGRDAAVAGHGLGPAGQPRDARERGLLREVGVQLEVRVEAGLDAAIRLEHEPPADHRGGVGLVATQRLLGGGRDPWRGVAPGVREAGRRPADEGAVRRRPAPRVSACPRCAASRRSSAPRRSAAARSRQAPSPSTASRTAPSRSTNGTRYRSRRCPRSPLATSTSASAVSGPSANACASRADEGTSPFATYQRREARSSRSSARTAAATAARSSVVRRPC